MLVVPFYEEVVLMFGEVGDVDLLLGEEILLEDSVDCFELLIL